MIKDLWNGIFPFMFIGGALAIQGLVLFAVVYLATRLAIRHERSRTGTI